jgi:ABC-type sugar transport system ATPase subunit
MATIEYRGVDKLFAGAAEALRDFNLQLRDGELMVLVGPSGCGKTTALRLLAGLEPVTRGDLFIDRRPVTALPPQQRDVAMVFQNYALYPHMTVRRNLEFPLRMGKLSRETIRRRVEHTAALLDLSALLERQPRQLSGGQRQRVAMGRAIVREPKAFLMDEPLSNLDAKLRVQIRTEIAALQQRLGVTTLYVTHDQVEAMTLGHRVAVMHGGRLQQVDTPAALYDAPANVFVAGFLGSPGMNVFPARMAQQHGRRTVFIAGGQRSLAEAVIRRHPRIAQYGGPALQAGLRPEAFALEARGEHWTGIDARVSAVESLGYETLVYFEPAAMPEAGQLVARLGGHVTAAPGDSIPLFYDVDSLYLFDGSGQAL